MMSRGTVVVDEEARRQKVLVPIVVWYGAVSALLGVKEDETETESCASADRSDGRKDEEGRGGGGGGDDDDGRTTYIASAAG